MLNKQNNNNILNLKDKKIRKIRINILDKLKIRRSKIQYNKFYRLHNQIKISFMKFKKKKIRIRTNLKLQIKLM